MSAAVAYKFLPWLREGAATLITTAEDSATAAASFVMPVEVRFTGGSASTPVNLFGPADVAGLAKDQITRREPTPGSTGFEPNYFPSVEFRQADLPWRFTPTRAAGEDRLRPWLALIAVERRDGVAVRALPAAPLPVITAPVRELPNPAELDRWAHVQVAGPFPAPTMDTAAMEAYVRNNKSRAVARVLCPRRLKGNSAYLVCLVPVFEIGRRAGLGESPDTAALKLQYAWQFDESSNQTIDLPVYNSWTVSTGPERDPRDEFERLARALHPWSIPAEAATRPFLVEAPLTTTPNLTMQLPGALRPLGSGNAPAAPPEVATNLSTWVNQSAQAEHAGGDAEVTPPIYARWQSGRTSVLTPGTPVWLNELNTDPRHRVTAAAGGDLVQRHQDEFIAEAWRQAGQIREANQMLRGAQTARSLNQALVRKHLEFLPAGMLLQVAGPDRSRIRSGEGTIQQAVSESAVPDSGVEATFRRVARVRGPHTRNWNIGASDEETETLFKQGYFHVPADSWTVVDQGTVDAPSQWERNPATGRNTIIQRSNIHSLPLDAGDWSKAGTMYLTGDNNWRDFKALVLVTSIDDDALGVVFRYTGPTSFYRFSMDSERSYRRLVKRSGNNWISIWQDNFRYTVGHTYTIQAEMEGNHLRLFFNHQKVVDYHDPAPLLAGKFGLYTWGNAGTKFEDLTIQVQAGLDRTEIAAPQVVDQGDFEGPSAWTTEDGNIRQLSEIRSSQTDRNELAKLGTYLKAVPDSLIPSWTDYSTRVMIEAQQDNALGLMFRYQGPTNFYRFSMDLRRSYQRLVKCVNGQYTLLWQRDEGFALNSPQWLEIIADGGRLRGYLGNRKLFELRDASHANGTVAFYCWGSAGARFTYAQVRGIRRQGVMARLNTGQLGVPVPPDGRLDLNALRTDLLASLAPDRLVSARTAERLLLPAMREGEDPLAPVGRAPEISVPLSTRLIDMAPELMLPGVNGVPQNAVVALETNPAFVAALLAGANHEMTRELLWRGPDTDVRATVFRQFWDVRGSATTAPAGDIEPIHIWPASLGLASQTSSESQAGSVFLIRSELLRRFPDARFYLVEAVSDGAGGRRPGTNISTPQFRGRFGDDIAFFGFAQPPAQVTGSGGGLGWYFVIEQRPDAGRFGLLREGPNQPADWTELGWNHVSGAAYARATPIAVPPPPGPQWGRNAAHMAAITQRRPFRLLMHANRLLT